jgi:hypothetical protein
MSETTVTLPSHAEIEALIEAAGDRINGLTFVEEYVIEDYPISFRDRGRCYMAVEFKSKKGWRTVKRTTNRRGTWCKPKSCTYDGLPIAVVTGEDIEKEAAWLRVSSHGQAAIYLQAANGDCEDVILRRPDGIPGMQPRREPHRYSMKVERFTFGDDHKESEVEHHEFPADPPEVCDAYDVWVDGLTRLVKLVKQKMPQAVSSTA